MRVLVVSWVIDCTHASNGKPQRDACHVIDISLGLGVMMINRANLSPVTCHLPGQPTHSKRMLPQLQQPYSR